MTEEFDTDYTAPTPIDAEGYMGSRVDPQRVLWVEGYGFEDDVFHNVIKEINSMFQDEYSIVVAEESDMKAKYAYKKALDETVR